MNKYTYTFQMQELLMELLVELELELLMKDSIIIHKTNYEFGVNANKKTCNFPSMSVPQSQ